jgi:asparagine synthase (glutamine-hydrolysing)
MPGIAGIISKNRSNQGAESGRISRMTEAMIHEPSYRSGTWTNPALGLYLGWACLDYAFANYLPIWNELKDVMLLFNGEVFADPAELANLKALGHDCGSDDAGYLVHLYEEYGNEWFSRLNGFFSGVLVDLRRGEATLFNDRFGMQRLYFHETDEEILFASEAKALLAADPHLRELSNEGLAESLIVGCVLENRTLFKRIQQLPGASQWIFDRECKLRKQRYFQRETWEQQEKLSPEAFTVELKETLTRILPRYLHSSHRIGMSMTGGLDTRLIMACGHPRPGELPCYTFASRYRDSYDVKIAREVANLCGQSYQPIRLDDHFLGYFPELAAKSVYISDGNFGVIGAAELYANQFAMETAPVRLTGNYGSEIMRGDGEFRPYKVNQSLFSPEFRGHLGGAVNRFGSLDVCSGVSFAAFRQAPWFNYSRLSLEQSKLRVRTPFMDNELVALMYRAPSGLGRTNELSFGLIREGDPRLARIPTDRGEHLTGSPLWSALGTRWHWLLKRAELAFDYSMPQKIAPVDRLLRPFHPEKLFLGRFGFLHFRTWFRTSLAKYLEEMLLDGRTLSRSIFERDAVSRAVRDHLSGKRNHTMDLHRLLTCELLERQLIENRP